MNTALNLTQFISATSYNSEITANPQSALHRIGIYVQGKIPTNYKILLEQIHGVYPNCGDGYEINIIYINENDQLEEEFNLKYDSIGIVTDSSEASYQAIHFLRQFNIPVFTLFKAVSSHELKGHIDVSAFKSGKTAAWYLLTRCTNAPRIGLLFAQDDYDFFSEHEIGFRSYIREQTPKATITEIITDNTNTTDLNMLKIAKDCNALYLMSGDQSLSIEQLSALKQTNPNLIIVANNIIDSNAPIQHKLVDVSLSASRQIYVEKIIQCVQDEKRSSVGYRPSTFDVEQQMKCIANL